MRQPIPPDLTAAGEPLVRAMGTFALAAAIVNITIGGGIFRLPASVAAALGPAAPIAYLVCAVAMGLIVVCIAEAGRRVPLTGGPYAYVATAFGPYAGFLSGVLLWMLGTFATAAVSTVFASSVALLIPTLYLLAFVWETRLAAQPSVTRLLFSGKDGRISLSYLNNFAHLEQTGRAEAITYR